MIKYHEAKVVFREIPDEVTLAISISNCPLKCIGCHSPELRYDSGSELDSYILDELIENNK